MNAPLYNRILSLTSEYPLHMPGHKRNAAFLPQNLLSLDITEIDGSDNLHNPTSVIMEAQQKMAQLYGSDYSFLCVNGGSSGVLAAVLGTCGENDTLLAVRNAHKSLHNALILSGAAAVYISPEITPFGFCGGVDPEKIEQQLKKHNDIRAVFVVSPTYEGFCCDVAAISEVVHRYNKILIVDETHGAHFPFNNAFPKGAISLGADIAIQSWHKTMPAPNQCAVLNIRSKRVDIDRIRQAFSMVTTTSPSYIFMGLMDYVRAYYTENRFYFENYVNALNKLRSRLVGLESLRLADKAVKGCGTVDFDISKLTFVLNCAESANVVSDALKKYGFQLEMTASDHIIAMTSVADDPQKLEQLGDALLELDKRLTVAVREVVSISASAASEKIVQRSFFCGKKIEIPLDMSLGRIAADFITPFPPDIPIVLAGEEITVGHLEQIEALMLQGAEIHGISDMKIRVLE